MPLDPKEDTPANPSLVTGISWGCLRVVDGNAGTVSSFPARTTVARHDRFCLQVLAWLVRPCGFDACPSCVSSSLVHGEAEGEFLSHTGTRIVCSSCGYLRPFPSSGEGSGGGVRPERRQPTPHLLRGLAGGLRSLTAMRARFRAFQHGQQSQDMTGSACRFWRGLCVRAGSMLAPWSRSGPRAPWPQARVKPKAMAMGRPRFHLRNT